MSADDPLYDVTVQKLKDACDQYRAKALDWKSLRDVVYQASDALGVFGERNIRNLLDWAKEELELLEYTVSGDDLLNATLKAVTEFEQELLKLENPKRDE